MVNGYAAPMQMDADDLARMNQVLRHRLRNVASGVKGAISYLASELDEQLSPEEKEYFPLILKECDALEELTVRLGLLFDALPAGRSAALAEVVRHAVSGVTKDFPHATFSVSDELGDASLTVPNACSVGAALREVLTNAVEAGQGSAVRVVMNRANREVAIHIEDDGAGTAPEEAWFLPFFTTRAKHMGIGLAIARRMMQSLGGRVVARRRPVGGTALEMTIPLKPSRAGVEAGGRGSGGLGDSR